MKSRFKTENDSLKKVEESAEKFLRQYYHERNLEGVEERLAEVLRELKRSGTYTHTQDELTFGSRLAWRNSNRCIGRLFYETLEVFDCRHLEDEGAVEQALRRHMGYATNGGRIRSAITIFRPEVPGEEPIRIWNPKLIRYAGYRDGIEGEVVGDPEEADFTRACEELGWSGDGTSFDILPVVFQIGERSPHLFHWSPEEALEVEIRHPELDWFSELGLRWYAVPVIADMVLEIGGIRYPAAPFNGWFMDTEIGARNFGDRERYNMLPTIAEKMGLDRRSKLNMWQDRAMVELNSAVLHSFREDGVRITDHHTASRQFMAFNRKERESGREVMADWAWIVPPLSASSMEVFHQSWENEVKSPNFYYNDPVWAEKKYDRKSRCPFHISSHS
ncbi:MAG: nitric oxide synthase oxygenase [Balneolaceae bacterium]|nr:nitric oxide synthase oxygenase [Balneolaceae bacterium]MCH8548244.1 nitric oxide synthase oxygenase [Balneolaceae bacterium]